VNFQIVGTLSDVMMTPSSLAFVFSKLLDNMQPVQRYVILLQSFLASADVAVEAVYFYRKVYLLHTCLVLNYTFVRYIYNWSFQTIRNLTVICLAN